MRLKQRGFTVAELLVATAVAGIAAAAMTATIIRQQRFFSAADEILATRAQLRDGADILASDLRGAAVGQFGLPVLTDTAVEMLTTIATSVVCTAPIGPAMGLPPASLASGSTLTSILVQPDTGDVALILAVPKTSPDSASWQSYRVASFKPRSLSTSCPPSTGFTTAGDAFSGATGFQLTLATNPSAPLRAGAPIHFLRRARYSFYRSSDGARYLGYRRCGAFPPFTCAAIQPVSGPYKAIAFRYFDESGGEITSAAESFRVARVEIAISGQSARDISLTGDSRRAWRDSIVVTVSPRNRMR